MIAVEGTEGAGEEEEGTTNGGDSLYSLSPNPYTMPRGLRPAITLVQTSDRPRAPAAGVYSDPADIHVPHDQCTLRKSESPLKLH